VRTGSAIFLPAPAGTLAAVAMSGRAMNAYPNRWEFVHTQGVALYRAGLWNQAIATLTTSMELRRGGDPFEWFFLAMAEHQRGNASEARRWFDRGENWFRRFPSPDPDIAPIRAEAAEVLGIPIDATVRKRPSARLDRGEKTTGRRSAGWSGVVSILIPAIMAKSVGRNDPP
jgi:hypothetical protein